MKLSDTLILLFWTAFLIYWLIAAAGAKKNLRGRRAVFVRFVILTALLIIFSTPVLQHSLINHNLIPTNPILTALGVLLSGLGIACAVWARVYLGSNWGMPMSLKEYADLITGGPYQFVRHPIYAGMLVALFGTVLVIGTQWLLVWAVYCIYFISSAKTEEKLMREQFPDAYRSYMKRTKMLIPFLY